MFTNTLSLDTLRGLKLIGKEKWLDFAYLAGGTALALRLGHRQSVDLDFLGVKVAGLEDIAAMKINAVEDRGSKRDFIDLYFLSKRFNFSKMLEFYDRKYRCLKSHKYNILKSLNYFEDAESEDSPRMFKSINWLEIKAFFQKEVKKLSSDLI